MQRLLTVLVLVAFATGSAPLRAQTDELSGRRGDIARTIEHGERGASVLYDRSMRAIADHPLRPWAEYAYLRRNLGASSTPAVEDYLARHGDIAPARMLRQAWLHQLARREAWTPLLEHYRETSDVALRCARLRAQQATTGVDNAWLDEAQALWLSPRSLPDACDPVFAVLAERGRLTRERYWERFELAAEAGELGLAGFLGRQLPEADSARARDYLAFLEAPHERASGWPRDARSRKIASLGLVRLARNDPDAAEAHLNRLSAALGMTEPETGPVLAQIALWTVASYGEASARRLAAVPASAYDSRLHEWRVREAIYRGDDAAGLEAIALMPEEQRSDSRWRYFQARLLERSGEREAAAAAYADAARGPNFHGFMAADRLGIDYALCPLEADRDRQLRRDVAAHPSLVRAIELYRIDRPGWAAREWSDALEGMSAPERIEAVRLARAVGWHDRMFSLAREDADELRYYRLRFPLSYPNTVREQASQHQLDPALIAAVTRAESAWMPRARSPADARGLMQVLPSTGAGVARRHGITWNGADTLYRPVTNLRLGTAYMREMLDRHGGRPYFALAAYNAGPAPVARWRQQRPALDPDLWIETIPYRETREYVARVMAFSVIYDWRLDGRAVSITDRLLGRDPATSTRREFACPDLPGPQAP